MNKGGTFKSSSQRNPKIFNDSVDKRKARERSKGIPSISSTGKRIDEQDTLSKGNSRSVKKHLSENEKLFEGSFQEILNSVNSTYKYYSNLEQKSLEIEVRLRNESNYVSYDSFNNVYKFLNVLVPGVEGINFYEQSVRQTISGSYEQSTVSRRYQNPEIDNELYQKLKHKVINLPIIYPFELRLGIGLEFPIIEENLLDSKETLIMERTRWSFVVDSTTMSRLPEFLNFYATNEKISLRFDLTRNIPVKSKAVSYSIELELLDTITPKDLTVEKLDFLDAWIKVISTVASRRGEYIDYDTYLSRISTFNSLLGIESQYFNKAILNNPTDLTSVDFSWAESQSDQAVFAKPGGCHISLKADGYRYLLYFSSDRLFMLSVTKNIMTTIENINPGINTLTGTILDVEMIGDLDVYGLSKEYTFIVFDCLAYQGKDIRIESYSDRLDKARLAIKETEKKTNGYSLLTNSKLFFKKTLLLPGPESKNPQSWFDAVKKFFDDNMEEDGKTFKSQTLPDGEKWEVDGFIITPENEPYIKFDNLGKHAISWVRKWKTNLTIDFRVSKDNNGRWGLYSHVVDKKGKDGLKYFLPEGIIYVEIPQEELEKYAYMIVECQWELIKSNRGTFKILRERFDRKTANPLGVANLLFRQSMDPITKEYFMDNNLRFMRSYHNRVKREILHSHLSENYQTEQVLVDLGSGKGGDQRKWNGYSSVFAVEPDPLNLEESIKRQKRLPILRNQEERVNNLSEINELEKLMQKETLDHNSAIWREGKNKNIKTKIKSINASAEDTEFLVKKIGKNEATVISLFNVLTFFYKSTEMLDQLLNTVDNLLNPEGNFFVISMDGEKLTELMGNRKVLKSQNLFLARGDEPDKIWIEIKGAIVRGQYEYLTKLDDFALLMRLRGYQLYDAYYLDQEPLMSRESSLFSSLFKVMKFKKGHNPRQIKLENSLRWLKEKNDMDLSIKMLMPDDRPVHVKSKYFDQHNIINLYRFGALGDGSCYLHAILRTMSKSYKAMSIPEKAKFIKNLREDLSNNYTISIHNSIGDGFFRESKFPEYSYHKLKKSLREVSSSISHAMLEYIGDQLEVNVYMIKGNQNAVPYAFGTDNSHIKPGRRNILIYWINENHYEPVGIISGNMVQFVFEDNHPLLKLF